MISTVPAAVDALVSRWRLALPGVQVVDGQPLAPEPDLVCIAFTGDPGTPAVESTRTRDQVTLDPDHEAYAITCVASSLQGGTDPKAVRDRAYELIDTLASDLAADQTLGGLVGRASLTTTVMVQQQTTLGAEATVQFVVNVDAWTS